MKLKKSEGRKVKNLKKLDTKIMQKKKVSEEKTKTSRGRKGGGGGSRVGVEGWMMYL